MQNTKTLWLALAILTLASFAVLGLLGREIYRQAPPIPKAVYSEAGDRLFTDANIERGRTVWQSAGGQQLGSIWGHGGYLAPDWSADWLHREATALLDRRSIAEYGTPYAGLDPESQAVQRARLQTEMRSNTYDPDDGYIVVSNDRAAAIRETAQHYEDLFGNAAALDGLREDYAIPPNAVSDEGRRQDMAAFFFWTAWASTTERPGQDITYTSNWPHEQLVGNTPSVDSVVWSVASVVLLIAGIGIMVWYYAVTHGRERNPAAPAEDPLGMLSPTPSMRATGKYFATVLALILTQIGLGIITAHYSVEGHELYGFPIADYLPYAVTRTWHTQLAVFWIATAWLATGLYIAPALSGKEPRFQRFGVNLLYGALLLVVVGSMAGEWLAVQQKMELDLNFWFGHQGYEYVDLGRFWQILLFVGLLFWLTLVGRALWPALAKPGQTRPLVSILFLSTVAIGLFYGAGLMWGEHTHLSIVEYWRWWVVHLWVEGFFEVFATAVIALLFVRLGLVRAQSANAAVLFATVIFLLGGILGTLHHLYWTGTPTSVLAVGAVFSALEVVPLALLGFEGYETYRHSKAAAWVATYRWPIMFFVAVAFWNLLGAGVFGFMINPPISLYYVQGLNTTPLHGHTALFGVYGMLGIGLMLFCLRGLANRLAWNDGYLKAAFWSLNIGLAGMAFMSLLPIGAIQAWASVSEGLWYARSAEFLHQPLVETLVWLRVPGDTVFAIGAIILAIFGAKLWLGRKATGAAVGRETGVAQAAE